MTSQLTLSCTNIQHHLSNYIHDMLLNSTEFTVWDRPWAPNEEARSSCCSDSDDRKELGRLRYIGEPLEVRANKNPLKQIEQRGGGLFELDWRERAKLLRQMVDWQCKSYETLYLSPKLFSPVEKRDKTSHSSIIDTELTI